jgi:hypothetical protein
MSAPSVPVAVGPPQPSEIGGGGYKGSHPVAAFFHIVFKLGALLAFIIGGLFSSASYVGVFIAVVLFLAADFWTVKNVTGRLLVAMRWWNEIKEDGSNEWIFECGKDASAASPFDSNYFWIVTYGNCIAWGILVVFNITAFSRLPMAVLGIVLGGSNAIGYTKCRRDATKKMSQFLMRQAVANAI